MTAPFVDASAHVGNCVVTKLGVFYVIDAAGNPYAAYHTLGADAGMSVDVLRVHTKLHTEAERNAL